MTRMSQDFFTFLEVHFGEEHSQLYAIFLERGDDLKKCDIEGLLFFLCSNFFFFFVIQNFGQIRVGNSCHVQIFHVHWTILQTYHVQFMINKCWIWVNICLVHFKNRLKSTFLRNFCLHYCTKRIIKESSSLKKIQFQKITWRKPSSSF